MEPNLGSKRAAAFPSAFLSRAPYFPPSLPSPHPWPAYHHSPALLTPACPMGPHFPPRPSHPFSRSPAGQPLQQTRPLLFWKLCTQSHLGLGVLPWPWAPSRRRRRAWGTGAAGSQPGCPGRGLSLPGLPTLQRLQHLPTEQPTSQVLAPKGCPWVGLWTNFLPLCTDQAWEKQRRGFPPAPLTRLGIRRSPPPPTPLVRWGALIFLCLGPPDPSGPREGVSSRRKGPTPAEPLTRSEEGPAQPPARPDRRLLSPPPPHPRVPFLRRLGDSGPGQARGRAPATPLTAVSAAAHALGPGSMALGATLGPRPDPGFPAPPAAGGAQAGARRPAPPTPPRGRGRGQGGAAGTGKRAPRPKPVPELT